MASRAAIERVVVVWSEQCGELIEALAQAQCEEGYGDIERTKTARIRGKSRSGSEVEFSFAYESLSDVLLATRPFLARQGIALMQFPFTTPGGVTIRTELRHRSGQFLYSDLFAVVASLLPQDVGSCISYLRRYAVKAVCAVSADDEGDNASERRPSQARRAQ